MPEIYRCTACGWYSETLTSPNITLGPIPQHKGCGGELERMTQSMGRIRRPTVADVASLFGGKVKRCL